MRLPPHSPQSFPWYIRIFFYFQKKKFGTVLTPNLFWARKPKLFFAMGFFFSALTHKKSPIPANIRSLVMVRVSQINHCPFCIDLNGSFFLQTHDQKEKLLVLHSWRTSKLFSEKEALSLTYAETMTDSHTGVTHELIAELKKHYSEDALIELTALIAFQNLSSKFNAALDIPSQNLCPLINKKNP